MQLINIKKSLFADFSKLSFKFLMALSLVFCVNLAQAYDIQLEPTMKAGDLELKIKGQGIRTKFGFNIYLSGLYLPDLDKLQALQAQTKPATPNKAETNSKTSKAEQKNSKEVAKTQIAETKATTATVEKVTAEKSTVTKAPNQTIKFDTAEQIIMADAPMAIRIFIMSSLVTGDRMAESTLEGFEKATKNNLGDLKGRVDQILEAFRAGVGKNTFADLIYIPNKGTEIILSGKSVMTIQGLDFKQALFRIWLGEDPVQDHLRKAMLGEK